MQFTRKMLAWAVGLALVVGLYVLSSLLVKGLDPTMMFATACSSIVLLTMAFIGGHVWDTFCKSKYFHQELVEK